MRRALRGAVSLAAMGLLAVTALPSGSAPTGERSLLGIRIWRSWREVLQKHGQPTRIETGAVTTTIGGGGGGQYTGTGMPGMPGLPGGMMMPGMPRMGGSSGGMMMPGMPGMPGAPGPGGMSLPGLPGMGGPGGMMRPGTSGGMTAPPGMMGGMTAPPGMMGGRGGRLGGMMGGPELPGGMSMPGMPGGMTAPMGMMGGSSGGMMMPGMPGMPGAPGGMVGGGGGGATVTSEAEVTWIYEKGSQASPLTYMFLFNKDGRVIQIQEFGYKGGGATSRGIRLGDPVSKIYRLYGWPDNSTKSGNQLTLDYSRKAKVAFQLLNQGKGTQVVGVTVALTETDGQ